MPRPRRIPASRLLSELKLVPTNVHVSRPIEMRLEAMVVEAMRRGRGANQGPRTPASDRPPKMRSLLDRHLVARRGEVDVSTQKAAASAVGRQMAGVDGGVEPHAARPIAQERFSRVRRLARARPWRRRRMIEATHEGGARWIMPRPCAGVTT